MKTDAVLISQARPYMTQMACREFILEEAAKGCLPDIAPNPVHIEPPYRPITGKILSYEEPTGSLGKEENKYRYRITVLLDPKHKCEWLRAENFLKQLQRCEYPLAFETFGNMSEIALGFQCHEQDADVLIAAFTAQYPACQISAGTHPLLEIPTAHEWASAVFAEYYPPPPYSHLLTRKNELIEEPLTSFLNILSGLPDRFLGFYQVIFAPVDPSHNWHANIKILLDLEFRQLNYEGMLPYQRNLQQLPSGELHGMAVDVSQKSHDKPIFVAVPRVGLVTMGEQGTITDIRPLGVVMDLFQHGGRPLQYVDHSSYRRILSPESVHAMFNQGKTHRPGFIVNSEELAGLVHLPSAPPDPLRSPLRLLDGAPPAKRDLNSGTPIGYQEVGKKQILIHIPDEIRDKCGHIIGKPGEGKSKLMEYMILDDILRGFGVMLLDPHGDLADSVLERIPAQYHDKVVYFAPGNPEWVPCWNLLRLHQDGDASGLVDNIVRSIRAISEGWGDRLEHLLRQTIGGLMRLGDASLLDVAKVISPDSKDREHLISRIIKANTNPMADQFWHTNIKGYTKSEVQPVLHKIGKLMDSDVVAHMLTQPNNLFDIPKIMNEGNILIADTSFVGPETRDILGNFLLAFVLESGMGRRNLPISERRPYRTYVDEAHRFVANTLRELILQARKFRVSTIVAHQTLSQFDAEDVDALCSAAFNVVFCVLRKDADRMERTIGGSFNAEELTNLANRQAWVRIDRDWVKITTPEIIHKPDVSLREAIINRSHEHFYVRMKDLRKKDRNSCDTPSHSSLQVSLKHETEEDYAYDVLLPTKDV